MQTKQPSLMEVKNLKVYFPIYRGILYQRHIGDIKAVDGISFNMKAGETLGLVGESGCGKSTTGRALLNIVPQSSGQIYYKGQEISDLPEKKFQKIRKSMQMIFQDPYASLNSRMNVFDIISEPMLVHKEYKTQLERKERVKELMNFVGLDPQFINRYPHEFSGGQRQRIGIARAISLNPTFIVCDEPTSALDVSIQAQIVNLLLTLQKKLNLTYLFISHDLNVVRHISDRIAVMYLGRLVEVASREELFSSPLHPYTKALLSAIPIPDPELEKNRKPILIEGDIPDPSNKPLGCDFYKRCPFSMERCKNQEPYLEDIGDMHYVSCYLYSK